MKYTRLVHVNNVKLCSVRASFNGTHDISYETNHEFSDGILDVSKAKLDAIRESLKALEPWYKQGKVGSPMDAVEALKNIDMAVNQ